MKHVIQLNNIAKAFITDEIQTHALQGINLTVAKGEYLAITGPSGCGKSTLLSILGLLDVPTEGEYWLSGNNVANLGRDQRADIRAQHLGFVFQSFNLISDLTVLENVLLPLTYQPNFEKKTAMLQAKQALEDVDMQHRMNHFPSQLSGGQQQRVAIARALINAPDLILADEPTGNLDSKNAQLVLDLFKKLNQQGKTICMVTHDPRSAESASRQIELFDGTIVSDRTVQSKSFAAAALEV
ncbi:ABC transporter ATP-binding protein [Pseudoalteromonas tunicata]|uniref:ABC transporter ATP-binding protein n=1 Tax=Pseudoalteromonas tunicata TaxID=314281 RepID=UPI00273F5F15|nr:ABC transporter ATP-binding protein [Pseudoalteromonas tunicata]MDP4983956.1 ABC transporter ATP-binding protein [Pseudoalteromonas tunicata]